MKPNPHIAAMDAYALADVSPDLTSLAQNESMRAPSPKVVDAARSAIENAHLYSDPEWTELRAAIAAAYDISADGILCGAGSMELIAALCATYLDADDRVLTTQYGYLFFRTATRLSGARIDLVAEDNFVIDVEAIAAAATPETRMVFIANPGNPTGTKLAFNALRKLRSSLPRETILVIDEAYGEFADTDNADSTSFDLLAAGNTVVLRTLSKAYGLAGTRVGWGAFPPAIACEVRKVLNPNNISGVSLAMATAAIADRDYMRETVKMTAQIRDGFLDCTRAAGVFSPESHTNFGLLCFATAQQARDANARMRDDGILARAMDGYGLSACLRVTVGDRDTMLRAGASIANFMKGSS